MQGDGDGWAAGPDGRKQWGRFGAAGLFLVADTDREPSVLLQLRALWTADGGTWGIPGGARDSHETPAEAALRETAEEAGVDPDAVKVLGEVVTAGPYPADDRRPELPGGWTYTTVVASTSSELATTRNDESDDLRWVPLSRVDELHLHPAFATALPELVAAWQRRGK